jgi:hypothetical protein
MTNDSDRPCGRSCALCASRKARLAVLVLSVSLLTIGMDNTILNVAAVDHHQHVHRRTAG